MKKLIALPLAVGALALILTHGVAAAAVGAPERIEKAGKVVFCTDPGFPPWEMVDAATQKQIGFDIDIAAAVTKVMGVSSEHKALPFDGMIPALQAGQCDAIISGLYDKPKRREVVDFALYATTGDSIILKAGSTLAVNSVKDLSGKKVATGIGTTGEGELDQASADLKNAGKPEIKVVAMPSNAIAFQQLSAGLVDAYVGSTDQAAYYNKLQPNAVKLVGMPLSRFDVGIATLHKDKALNEAFKAAVKEIIKNGEYGKILKRWGFSALAIH